MKRKNKDEIISCSWDNYKDKTFEIQCNFCGGFDIADVQGVFIRKHTCKRLNQLELLSRIAVALEKIAGDK
jgi:hypothetical protein